MPDRCTPEYERTVAKLGSLLPYRRAPTLLAEFLPLGKPQAVETTRQRTLRVRTRLEQEAVAGAVSKSAVATKSIALSIDSGHVRASGQYQGRTFEILLAQVSNDKGKQVVFASVPAEATSQTRQLRGVLHGLGATPAPPVTILSDGADGPRSLGQPASPGPTRHVLDWFHLAMPGCVPRCGVRSVVKWPAGATVQCGKRLPVNHDGCLCRQSSHASRQ
jgi:hypothetical protein